MSAYQTAILETDSVDALRAEVMRHKARADTMAERLERFTGAGIDDGFFDLVASGIGEAERAIARFPQPNYVISKVAEEAGEVVKAAIHCAEGRESLDAVAIEMKQAIAMLYRLWIEGDQVHGLAPVAGVLNIERQPPSAPSPARSEE
jgi:hypothetical protein